MKKLMESFINDCENGFSNYFESQVEKHLKNREDYKEVTTEITKLKEKTPKVREFIDHDKIIDLTDDDKIAILKLISLNDDIEYIEKLEAFKLGFKEAYVFFKEQGMLVN